MTGDGATGGPGDGMTPVVVVGAGLTGLAIGWELRRRGLEVRVLERAPEVGGVVRSRRVDGRVLDLGPQRARLVPPVRSLVQRLGIEEELLLETSGNLPLYVYHEGRLGRVPLGPGELLSTRLLSWRGKLRLCLEPFTGPARAGETVGEYVRRKLGAEAYERIVAPLYGGLYGSDPGDMLVDLTLGRALESLGFRGRSLVLAALRRGWVGQERPPSCAFRPGMQRLPEALAECLGDRVRTSTEVREVERAPAGDGWRLATDAGEWTAREVVLTVPAPDASALLGRVAPEASRRLGRLRYNPLALVHLEGRCESLHGYGYQIARTEEGFATRGVTWNASIFGEEDAGREDVYTAYLGGVGRESLVGRADGWLAERAVREFERVTGCASRALLVSRTRMPAWDRSWSALEELELPEGITLAAAYTARAGIPGRIAEARETAGRLEERLEVGEGREA